MPQKAVNGPYVDYAYYTDIFHGSQIPEKSFAQAEQRAEDFLRQLTFGRIDRLSEIPTEVKDALCAMAQVSYQEGKRTPGARSETIDGYSISYGGVESASSYEGSEMQSVARVYLGRTGLLFKGRSRRYDCKC